MKQENFQILSICILVNAMLGIMAHTIISIIVYGRLFMISKRIIEVFDELKLPAFYISKGNFKESCVVFNYTETPSSFADNEEDTTSYDFLLNLYDR